MARVRVGGVREGNGHAQLSSVLLPFCHYVPRKSKHSQLLFEDLSLQGSSVLGRERPAVLCICVCGGGSDLIPWEYLEAHLG